MRESTGFLFFGFILATIGLGMIINPIHAVGVLLIFLGMATVAGSVLLRSDEDMEVVCDE